MQKSRLALSLGLLSFALAVYGADDSGPGQRSIETLDTDGDGVVSFLEFQEAGTEQLTNLDTDQNGVLTIDEFLNGRPGPGFGSRRNRSGDDQPDREFDEEQQAQRQERMAQMQEMMTQRATERFQEMDADGDEIVTIEEFQEANFVQLDRDNDGVLTAQELRPQRGGRGGFGRGSRDGQRGQRGPGGRTGAQSPQA